MRMGMSAGTVEDSSAVSTPNRMVCCREQGRETMVKAMVEGDLRENIGMRMGGGNTGNPGW